MLHLPAHRSSLKSSHLLRLSVKSIWDSRLIPLLMYKLYRYAPSYKRHFLSATRQELSSCWDGRPFGHNRHGPKAGRGCCGGLGPHLTQCGLGRGISLYQVASQSIQPFGLNCRNAMLLRAGIPLRTIFVPSLVVKTFTVRVHWVIARY